MKIPAYLASALLLGAAAPADPNTGTNTEDAEKNPLITLNISEDITVDLGGRIHLDWTWVTGDDAFDTDDGVEFRRTRLGATGKAYDWIDFKVEFDFAGGDADYRNVWLAAKDLYLGDFKVGHFKEPFSLEQQTSSRFITFIERSLADTFAPMYNTGAAFSNTFGDSDYRWAFGVFRDTDSAGNDNDGDEPDSEVDAEYAFTGRVSGPVVQNEDNTVHLGASFSLRSPDDDEVRFRARPEAHLLNRVADTGTIAADDVYLAGAEAAWVGGPFSVQGEYIMANVEGQDSADDADYFGWYVEGSYFLTGENRNYKKSKFDRVRPENSFTRDGGGRGAHQLAVRYSMLDLDDGPSSDELSDITVGYNWWINPHTAVKFNYIRSNYESGSIDDDADIFIVRFQLDF